MSEPSSPPINAGSQRLSRRSILQSSAVVGTAALMGQLGAAPGFARSPGKGVAVLGGGMAGLAAAHELVERGFEVTVFEPTAWGGKARSIPVAGYRERRAQGASRASTASGSSRASTTTCRTRCGVRRSPGNANGVWDNLVAATERQVRPGR